MPITLNGDTGIQTPMYNGTISSNAVTPSVNMKSRIINGAMQIDQRNNGASVTATDNTQAVYVVDRWAYRVMASSKLSYQRSTVAPAGFTNSMLITSLSAYTVGTSEFFSIRQPIEGFNVADLGWGTANAQTVTISFWVRSSLTGTFGGSVWNNSENRSYVFSYTINAANTWEQKSVTIAGDTTGTWTTNNTNGLMLQLCVGAGSGFQNAPNSWISTVMIAPTGQVNLAGTNGATFYLTGVQLERGSTATSFDYRPYGTELALCQRYYQKSYAQATVPATATTVGSEVFVAAGTGGEASGSANLRVTMRATPTITVYSTATGASGNIRNGSTGTDIAVSSVQDTSDSKVGYIAASRTTGQIYSYQWIASIEL